MNQYKALLLSLIIVALQTTSYPENKSDNMYITIMRKTQIDYWYQDKIDREFCSAIQVGDVKKMNELLQNVTINKKGKNNISFLIYAYLKENKTSYKYLLQHGADPDAIMNAEILFNGDKLTTIIQLTAMTVAAEDRYNSYYLEMALKYKGNPNTVINNTHILHFAIRNHSLTNVLLLLGYGSDPNGNIKDTDGFTPLYHSISTMQYDIAYYLLQKGANAQLNKDDILYSINEFSYFAEKKEMLSKEMVKQVEYRNKVIEILNKNSYRIE